MEILLKVTAHPKHEKTVLRTIEAALAEVERGIAATTIDASLVEPKPNPKTKAKAKAKAA